MPHRTSQHAEKTTMQLSGLNCRWSFERPSDVDVGLVKEGHRVPAAALLKGVLQVLLDVVGAHPELRGLIQLLAARSMCFVVVAADEYHRRVVLVALLNVHLAGVNSSLRPEVSPSPDPHWKVLSVARYFPLWCANRLATIRQTVVTAKTARTPYLVMCDNMRLFRSVCF